MLYNRCNRKETLPQSLQQKQRRIDPMSLLLKTISNDSLHQSASEFHSDGIECRIFLHFPHQKEGEIF